MACPLNYKSCLNPLAFEEAYKDKIRYDEDVAQQNSLKEEARLNMEADKAELDPEIEEDQERLAEIMEEYNAKEWDTIEIKPF
jgi:hypothetical protein